MQQFSMVEKRREGGSRGGGGITLSLSTLKSAAMAINNIEVDICIKYLQHSIDLSISRKPCTSFSCDIRKNACSVKVSLRLYILLSCKTLPSLLEGLIEYSLKAESLGPVTAKLCTRKSRQFKCFLQMLLFCHMLKQHTSG